MDSNYVEEMKNRVLTGGRLQRDEVMKLSSEEPEKLWRAADEIRRHFCGEHCDVCSVISVKEGRCTENCKYCAQSAIAEKEIPALNILGKNEVVCGAKCDRAKGSERYCLVASGRRLSRHDVELAQESVRQISEQTDINICASFGLLEYEDFEKLKNAGLSMIHNNVETSPAYFKKVCESHSQEDKINTIKAAKRAGLMVCSGTLFGMGESMEDRVDTAFLLRDLEVDSVPMNILNPREGTPFYDKIPLSQEEYATTVALFRFVMPRVMIRLAAGRGRFGDGGSLALSAGANAVISGDFLTTDGTTFESDFAMIKAAGMSVSDPEQE
jgi:biotin synthase